jgi:hypothetical protein
MCQYYICLYFENYVYFLGFCAKLFKLHIFIEFGRADQTFRKVIVN